MAETVPLARLELVHVDMAEPSICHTLPVKGVDAGSKRPWSATTDAGS